MENGIPLMAFRYPLFVIPIAGGWEVKAEEVQDFSVITLFLAGAVIGMPGLGQFDKAHGFAGLFHGFCHFLGLVDGHDCIILTVDQKKRRNIINKSWRRIYVKK